MHRWPDPQHVIPDCHHRPLHLCPLVLLVLGALGTLWGLLELHLEPWVSQGTLRMKRTDHALDFRMHCILLDCHMH